MRDIEVKRATAFPGVPTMWIAIASLPDLDKRDLSSLVSCGSGGAPLPVEVAKVFERKTGMKLKSGWGMTETCSPGTGHPTEGPDKPGSIGLMLPGIEMDVVVARRSDARCCRRARSAKSASRGRTSPRATGTGRRKPREAFVGDRFLTGDIGYMDDDGYFYLVDRKKDMIISGGFNVYPQMIEQAIYDASRRAGSDRDRHSRRLSRRGGKGLHQAARRRQAVHARRAARLPHRQARQARDSGRARIRRSNCRARRSASCRATNCATSSLVTTRAAKQQQLATGGRS